MGTSDGRLSAPHLVQLKWLDAFHRQLVEVDPGSRSGVEADPKSTGLAKIALVRPSDSSNVYYLSYRRASRSNPLSAAYTGGVNIHIFNGGKRDSGFTRFIRSLSDGESYTDGPMTIRQLSHVPGDKVRIRIDLDGARQNRYSPASGRAPGGTIQSLSSGKCLDVARGSKADGAAVIQYDCHAGLNQQWRVRERGSDSYEIVNANSGKCLQVQGGAAAPGAPVVQWTCTGKDDQLWMAQTSSGGQALKGVASGLCLDLPHASAESSTSSPRCCRKLSRERRDSRMGAQRDA